MKKLFQNPIVAVGVLILAVIVGVIIGQIRKPGFVEKEEAKKPTALLNVKYDGICIYDSAHMLSDDTKNYIEEKNAEWSKDYGGLVAVATVPTLKGWSNGENAGGEEYATALGKKWGLGAYDMLLLLVKDEYWYVVYGDAVHETIGLDVGQNALTAAMDIPYYKGQFDEAVVEFFRAADAFYPTSYKIWKDEPRYENTDLSWDEGSDKPAKTGSGVNILLVILLIGGIFLVWAVIDRIRYGRYQRRVAANPMTRVSYYPIFWGRPARTVVSSQTGTYHRPSQTYRPSGTYHSSSQQTRPPIHKPGAQPANTQSSRPPVQKPGARPATPAKPASKPGGFGRGGFGGGKR